MPKYFIQTDDKQYWTGSSWSNAYEKGLGPVFAKQYTFDEGLALINRKWAHGIKRYKRTGKGVESFMVATPTLRPVKLRLAKRVTQA